MTFEHFALHRVVLDGVALSVRVGGSGPVVVLLHGHPRTHMTWHRVAPTLAQRFTVVCPDLPGYGSSSCPEPTADHSAHSKRAMADSLVDLLAELGHERYCVVGHDRGSYVALRLALDHPQHVSKLVVLDSVPIGEALARADARFATAWWHWFFLGQTAKPAERVIDADSDAWYRLDAARMGRDNFEDCRRAIHDPATVHAMCEDYRAGLTVDRAHDEADMSVGRQVECPTLMLWSSDDDLGELYGDPLEIWRSWAPDLRGGVIASGHHMAEDAPEELARLLIDFVATD